MAEMAAGYYSQDLVKPSAIFHGFDFGDNPERDGNFGYIYNFLDYYFEEHGVAISARHYLDEAGKVSVRDGDLKQLDSDFGQRVLMFLMLRYDDISYLGKAGYAALPDDLATRIQARLSVHMQQFD